MLHERAILVAVAYLIGLTTSYIGFGISYEVPGFIPKSDVIEVNGVAVSDAATKHDVSVRLSDSGLYAVIGDQERIISGKLTGNIEPGRGFHVAVPHYEVSPSGEFVYYCEQQNADQSDCNEYVYVVAAHTVKPLKIENNALVSSVIGSSGTWLPDGRLQHGGYVSQSSDNPWTLITQ